MGVFLIIISESISRPWQFPLPQKSAGRNSESRIRSQESLRRENHPYDLLARTLRQVEAVGHVAPSSHCQPFDMALRAYSGQAMDLQKATREPACAGHADRPGIRIAEYCLVITQRHLLLWPW